MEQTWARFEEWLSVNWPEGLASLNPPATDAQIGELEAALGVRLPADFVACLKVHNGQSGYFSLLDGQEFLSCQTILEQWQVWKGLLDSGDFAGYRSSPMQGIKDDWWNPCWIPFTHNGGGDHLCLDLDPTLAGTAGQVITMWHDAGERERIALGFGAYFDAYVQDVLDGRIVYDEDYGGLVDVDDL